MQADILPYPHPGSIYIFPWKFVIIVSPYYSNSSTTGATSGAGTAYSSEAHEFNPVFIGGSCYSIFSFQCSVLFFIVCLFVLFILAIVLSTALRAVSDHTLVVLVSSKTFLIILL